MISCLFIISFILMFWCLFDTLRFFDVTIFFVKTFHLLILSLFTLLSAPLILCRALSNFSFWTDSWALNWTYYTSQSLICLLSLIYSFFSSLWSGFLQTSLGLQIHIIRIIDAFSRFVCFKALKRFIRKILAESSKVFFWTFVTCLVRVIIIDFTLA